MLFADRKKLWPRLVKLGEMKVREMLAADQFEGYEEVEVQEWLTRQVAMQGVLARQVAVDAHQATNDIQDIKDERGCRRLIRENWAAIKSLYGKDADARQVLIVLKRNQGEDEKLPKLKTVQNNLIKLRNERLIP